MSEDILELDEDEQIKADNDKKIMAFVVDKSKKWREILGLLDWEILFDFVEEIEEDNMFPTIMQVSTSWGMQQAVIKVSLEECYTRDEENLEKDVLHELLHVTVNEMRWDVSHTPEKLPGCACDHQHEERIVTVLTRTIWQLGLEVE